MEGVEDATPTLKPIYETLAVDMEKGEGELTMQNDHSGLSDIFPSDDAIKRLVGAAGA